MKQCSKCKQRKLATVEYFTVRYGKITSLCRACHREYHRGYRANNLEKRHEIDRRYLNNHRNEIYERRRYRRARNLDEARAYERRYYANNRERFSKSKGLYVNKNRDKTLTDSREYAKRYRARNPEYARVNNQRRYARKQSLPDTLTAAEWQRALDYFGGCCAYCGRQADFWTVISPDHFIALKDPRPDNPGTVATNIIPACHTKKGAPIGEPCCNNSKTNKDPVAWLTQRFGEKKAADILKRIHVYFAWIKE